MIKCYEMEHIWQLHNEPYEVRRLTEVKKFNDILMSWITANLIRDALNLLPFFCKINYGMFNCQNGEKYL